MELQRKYKIMETNRRAYTEDAQVHIKRQRAIIDKLKEENDALKGELSADLSAPGALPTPNVNAEIIRLTDFGDLYMRKIDMERRRVEELDQHLALSEAAIIQQKKAMGGVGAAKENDQLLIKQVRVLENKLDKTLMNFNEAISHNKKLRDEIDVLRRERITFDEVYKKANKELAEKKREMANVVEITNIAYEARDQAHNEIAALRAQGDREAAQFDAEWRELGRIIEHDKKMKEADMRNKLKAAELGLALAEGKETAGMNTSKGDWATEAKKGASQLALYEEAFKQIKKATGMTDIDDLVTAFIAAEDQNFSLFNFVNELNKEQEKLEEQAAELRAEIARYQGSGSVEHVQRKRILLDLEKQLVKMDANTQQYEKRFEATQMIFDALKEGVASMYAKLGCDDPSNRELLGDQGVTEANILSYLGVIEQRSNEILQMYAAATSPEDVTQVLGATGPLTPSGKGKSGGAAGPATIVPPSTAAEEDDDEDSDDGSAPLTREELQAKTLRALSRGSSGQGARRGANAAGGGARKAGAGGRKVSRRL